MRFLRPLGPLIVIGSVVVAVAVAKKAKPLIEKMEKAVKDFGTKVADEMKDEQVAAKEEASASKDAATKSQEKTEPAAEKAKGEAAAKSKGAKTKKAPTKTPNRKPKATAGRRRPATNVETG